MNLEEILEFLKKEFPSKAIDISESLELLNDTIDGVMKLINSDITKACDDRDFKKLETYTSLAKSINVYEKKIEEIINIAKIDELENDINITENVGEKYRTLPNYKEYIVDNKLEHTLYENFTHIRPYGFTIRNSEIIEVKTWQEMLITTCEVLISKDEQKFLTLESNKHMQGKKNKYFSFKLEELRKGELVAGKMYIETNMSGNGIRNLILKLLKEFGFAASEYKVYFRADYTTIN